MNPQSETDGEADPTACSRAKQDALRFLAYRSRSQAEVRLRLEKRYSGRVVERVLAELRDQRYLDDASFAREWRQHREQRRPRSQGLLRRELQRLGVDPEVVRETLDGFDAAENAYRAGHPLARRLAGGDYPSFRRRLWSHLQRRGFDHAVIGDVVSRLWRELADPLNGSVDADSDQQQRENAESEGADPPAYEEGDHHGGSGDPGQSGASFPVD